MNDYYQILGVPRNASMEQIKKAYRTKAKRYHPDINKAPDAHEKFILINEAFEYFDQLHNHKKSKQYKAAQASAMEEFWQAWHDLERQKARERAREHARMKYEAYLKSDVYRTTEAVNSIVDFIGAAFLMLFIFGIPIFAYLQDALWIGLIIILPSFPLWIKFLVSTFNKEFVLSLIGWHASTIRSKIFRLMIFTVINGIVFFNTVLNTVITWQTLLIAYAVTFFIAYLASRKVLSRYYRYLIRLVLVPGLVGLIFFVNSLQTKTFYTESYWYTYPPNVNSKIFFTIKLDDHRYDNYTGIRLFFDSDRIIRNSCITYTFSKGLLGLDRVIEVTTSNRMPEM
ncbi:DnaJ domain-containing protein [Carboxylicivirga caseinilyticus]|uniref:J domain-containing protein n=1 Tax=Carboxylicivirga caseinilyticus TaxID=3417572 RepID=UPI003D32C3BD|nr:DnaJ domain-containing protein [Marinilabiliaceae bacterium A049]